MVVYWGKSFFVDIANKMMFFCVICLLSIYFRCYGKEENEYREGC